jgi:hypothetical protein
MPKTAKIPPVMAKLKESDISFEVLKIISAGKTVETKPIKNAQLKAIVLFG